MHHPLQMPNPLPSSLYTVSALDRKRLVGHDIVKTGESVYSAAATARAMNVLVNDLDSFPESSIRRRDFVVESYCKSATCCVQQSS